MYAPPRHRRYKDVCVCVCLCILPDSQINRHINILVPPLAVPMATCSNWLFKASGRCLLHFFLVFFFFFRQNIPLLSLAAILVSTYTFGTRKNSSVMAVSKHISSGMQNSGDTCGQLFGCMPQRFEA